MSSSRITAGVDRGIGLEELAEHAPITSGFSDPADVRDIWGGMEGEIWVIHPALNRAILAKELRGATLNQSGDTEPQSEKDRLTECQVAGVMKCLSRYGNQVAEGDASARSHIVATLRCLYDPERIHEINSWSLGSTTEEIEQCSLFQEICQHNIVLIGGPVGNMATRIFLKRSGLDWLFSNDAPHQLNRYKDDIKPMVPEGEPPALTSDCGVFIRVSNPFKNGVRLYGAMGAYAWGTQAAAAAACAARSASEVQLTSQVVTSSKTLADIQAWVRVRPKMESSVLQTFEDTSCCYQIEWPAAPDNRQWSIHTNPGGNIQTLSMLQRRVTMQTLENLIFRNRFSHVAIFGASVSVFTATLLDLFGCRLLFVGKRALIAGLIMTAVSFLTSLRSATHLMNVTISSRD